MLSTVQAPSFGFAFAYFVWLPLAKTSPLLFMNLMDVNANVLPTKHIVLDIAPYE